MKRVIILVLYITYGFISTAQKCDLIKETLLCHFHDTAIPKLNVFYEFRKWGDDIHSPLLREELKSIVPNTIAEKFLKEAFYQSNLNKVSCNDELYNYLDKKQSDSLMQVCHEFGWREIIRNYKLRYQYAQLFLYNPIIVDKFAFVRLDLIYYYMNGTFDLFIFKKEKGKFSLYKKIHLGDT